MFDIGPTPLDVRLVAFGIPIRVHPSFWLLPILFYWRPERMDLVFIFVLCAFFSVLVHELGHALTSEMFGWPSQIFMYFGGGLAVSERQYNPSLWKNILVSLMGPGAGFLLYGMVELAAFLLEDRVNAYVLYVFYFLKFMNLWWGLLNLLPVLPLDGGQISAAVFQLLRVRDPVSVTYTLSAVTAGVVAYYGFVVAKEQFLGVMMLMFCFQSVAVLSSRR